MEGGGRGGNFEEGMRSGGMEEKGESLVVFWLSG